MGDVLSRTNPGSDNQPRRRLRTPPAEPQSREWGSGRTGLERFPHPSPREHRLDDGLQGLAITLVEPFQLGEELQKLGIVDGPQRSVDLTDGRGARS